MLQQCTKEAKLWILRQITSSFGVQEKVIEEEDTEAEREKRRDGERMDGGAI